MLRYTTLGAKFLIGVFVALAGIAFYLPFLEAFALTPAIAFIHRFSITVNILGGTKTLQPIVFIIPILLVKGLLEYHKRYGLGSLFRSKLVFLLTVLVSADFISIISSTSRSASLSVFFTHSMNWAIFMTSSIWLAIATDLLSKEKFQKIGIALAKTLAITLIGFTLANAVVSLSQFFDCSLSGDGSCTVWEKIDTAFPNKLLPVGHQKFTYKPVVIRAPGFFGDVNFNGMFSLFIVLLGSIVFLVLELLKKEKGYHLGKEQLWLLLPIGAGLLSFALTLSRSAILGAGVTGIVLFIVLLLPLIKEIGISDQLKKKLLTAVGIVSIVSIGFFLLGYAVPLSYDGRSTTLSKQIVSYVKEMFKPEEDSAQGHAELFKSAVKIGNQNSLFGMGMGTFGVQYEKLIKPGSGTNANPHSTYGMLYAEQGIMGLITYGGVILALWFSAIKAAKDFTTKLLRDYKAQKRYTREYYVATAAELFFTLISFGIPFFSIATASYYGFFLPMAWWWGSGLLLNNRSDTVRYKLSK